MPIQRKGKSSIKPRPSTAISRKRADNPRDAAIETADLRRINKKQIMNRSDMIELVILNTK